ncbi:DUF11 domain-containing protein [Paenibacillus glycinis]|uniref:DUF11 domain-containing protein n=1 Tax=Paenibacillus glycinis TaxID=2697035 RepID=A0ABW9XNN1_9BACL|nr:DUF11 domain-containing protein [Paenibacillus glycinis]NBD24234.1 DUF11 domain-containing protein [Paenibacillus glycinis]
MNRSLSHEHTPPSVTQSANSTELTIGGTIVFTFAISNPGTAPLARAVLRDMLPAELSFAENSVTVGGAAAPGVDPESGIPVGPVAPKASVSVLFAAIAVREPQNLIAVNLADLSFEFVAEDGLTVPGTAQSNPITLMINEEEE